MNDNTGPTVNRTGQTTAGSGAAKPKRGGARKVTRSVVAMSAAAILAVYAVGYAHTESAAVQVAAQTNQVFSTQASANLTAGGTAGPASASTSQYKDGTY